MSATADRKKSLVRKKKYKQLLEVGGEIESTSEAGEFKKTFNDLAAIIERANSLNAEGKPHERVENTTEVVMDVNVLKMAHDITKSTVQKMTNIEFDEDEFANKLLELIGPDRNWNNISQLWLPSIRMVRTSQSMYGTFDLDEPLQPEAKVLSQKQRAKRNRTVAAEKRPESVRNEDESEQIDKMHFVVKELSKVLNKFPDGFCNYWQLIIDPDNFMNTVENAFQLSFLCRDRKVFFHTSTDDDECYVRMAIADEQSGGETFQSIQTLSPETCDLKARQFGVTRPLMNFLVDSYDVDSDSD